MFKRSCTQLGLSGSFSKLRCMKQLLLQHSSGIGKLAHESCGFSSTSRREERLSSLDTADSSQESNDGVMTVEEELAATGKALHIPVMLDEVRELFAERKPKTILDMTFGAGGHSRALLSSLPDCTILALDRDPAAYSLAQKLAAQSSGRVTPLIGRFSDLAKLLSRLNIPPDSIDGALFDLGSSSMQFDQSERGFSLSRCGPLDMRMDGGRLPDQPTAADVVNLLDEIDLAKVLKKYGEESRAKQIAHGIVDARSAFGKITTTQQLADIISSICPGAYGRDSLNRNAHVATKTFQALRIFVNNEMNELHNGLEIVNKYLKPNGVCVAISFHSLEDRIVKRNFHSIELDLENNMTLGQKVRMSRLNMEYRYSEEEIQEAMKKKWQPISRKVILPSTEEINKNPRSRSARLRAAFKKKLIMEIFP